MFISLFYWVKFSILNFKVIDHTSFDEVNDDGSHTTISIKPDQIIDAPKLVGARAGPISFDGVGMKLDPSNKRVFPIAVGSRFSYSWYPQDKINEYPLAIGEDLVLVAGLQVWVRHFSWFFLFHFSIWYVV